MNESDDEIYEDAIEDTKNPEDHEDPEKPTQDPIQNKKLKSTYNDC